MTKCYLCGKQNSVQWHWRSVFDEWAEVNGILFTWRPKFRSAKLFLKIAAGHGAHRFCAMQRGAFIGLDQEYPLLPQMPRIHG